MNRPSGADLVAQLVAMRVQQRRTQDEIAHVVGVSRVTIARFETETQRRRSPSLHVLQRYATAVGARIVIETR